jgi:hypothetical protein
MGRTFPRLLAPIVLLAMAAPSRAVEGPPAPPPPPATSVDDARRIVAESFSRLGGWCKARDLRNVGLAHHRQALAFAPDLEASRIALGFRRSASGRWETRPQPEAPADKIRTVYLDGLEVEMRRSLGEAAKRIATFAAERDAAGDGAPAEEAWRLVLLLDPTHLVARQALRLEEAAIDWAKAPPRQKTGVRDRLRRKVESLPEANLLGGRLESPTKWLKALGTGAGEAGDGRFHVASQRGRAEASLLVAACHVGEATLPALGMVASLPAKRDPWSLIVVTNRESFELYVDWFHAEDAREREFLRRLSGANLGRGCFLDLAATPESARAFVLHRRAEDAFYACFPKNGKADWLAEGAGLLSNWVHGDTFAFCIARSVSAGKDRDFPEPPEWENAVREILARDAAVPFDLLLRRTQGELDCDQVLQAFSFLAWLCDTSPRAVQAFLRALESMPADRASWHAFGAPLDAVERTWRSWALR